MFRTVPLSIIRSFSLYIQQWYMSYRFADSLQAGSGVSKPVWHIPLLCVYTVKNSWWWTEGLSETCRISFQNKFEKLVHLLCFIIWNLNPAEIWTLRRLGLCLVTVLTRVPNPERVAGDRKHVKAKFTPYPAMKAHSGITGIILLFLKPLLQRRRQVFGSWSTKPLECFISRKETLCPLDRRNGGPQDRSVKVRKISSVTGFDPRTVQPIFATISISVFALRIQGPLHPDQVDR